MHKHSKVSVLQVNLGQVPGLTRCRRMPTTAQGQVKSPAYPGMGEDSAAASKSLAGVQWILMRAYPSIS